MIPCMATKTNDALKRLGGGRWETRDGRFAIEPQSGTWAVVDTTQTDDLGLPLVLGLYKSLTAAKEGIETARESGPAASPLADQLKRAREETKESGRTASKAAAAAKKTEPPSPPAPSEPKWLADLGAGDRRRAKDLLNRLEALGVDAPEEIVREDLVDDAPALTRVALGRRLGKLAADLDLKPDAVKRLAALFGGGRDDDLGVRWRLVDGDGREVGRVEVLD